MTDALVKAIWRRGSPNELLYHPGQGSAKPSESFHKLLADHDMACSARRAGDYRDDAAMESFFSMHKGKRVSRKINQIENEVKVFDYIERLFSTRRRHSTLGFVSPMQFEKLAQ